MKGSPNGSAGGLYGKADVPDENKPKSRRARAASRIAAGPMMKKRGDKPLPVAKIKGL